MATPPTWSRTAPRISRYFGTSRLVPLCSRSYSGRFQHGVRIRRQPAERLTNRTSWFRGHVELDVIATLWASFFWWPLLFYRNIPAVTNSATRLRTSLQTH